MSLTSLRTDREPADGVRVTHPFVLPHGYVDGQGRVHREGLMRPATVRDEIAPQADPRVRANPAYLTVLLLARTITRLGDISPVDAEVVEDLFASDLAVLQELYRSINQPGWIATEAQCPGCGRLFPVDLGSS